MVGHVSSTYPMTLPDTFSDECMRRLSFLVRKGARVSGTGAVEAASEIGRSAQIVELLRAREQEESVQSVGE
jgi:hypothetical protein